MLMVCDFSPIAFYILKFPVHWYSLAYIFGILFALFLAERLSYLAGCWKPKNNLSGEINPPSSGNLEAFLNYAIVGIIVGGRLGHVLFYDFAYYYSHPHEILQVWKGGMSFFGGFLGAIGTAAIFCSLKRIDFWNFADLWAVGAPIGLFLGRLANFINGELLGKWTTMAWGVIFKDGVLRHPSQIYEALSEGIVLFCVMLYCFYKKQLYFRRKALSGIFCLGYGIARFVCEFFREPDSIFSEDLLIKTGLNLNQYMSIGIFFLGMLLFLTSRTLYQERTTLYKGEDEINGEVTK